MSLSSELLGTLRILNISNIAANNYVAHEE